MFKSDHYAIILCGGSGTRLWPLSRSSRPKHLLHLNGNKTLLQETLLRTQKKICLSHIYVVTHKDHFYEVKDQINDLQLADFPHIIVEPVAKNTLPAISSGVKAIYDKNPDALIAVFPSDHAIDNHKSFLDAWDMAEKLAQNEYFVLLGIKPLSAATGYGYIKPDNLIDIPGNLFKPFRVKQFIEKPDIKNAAKLIEEGCFWNSGIFIFKAHIFLNMLHEYQPKISSLLSLMNEENLEQIYERLPNLSVDYGLVEKANNVAVVPVDMAWNDLGNWETIYQNYAKNIDRNVIKGDVTSVDSFGNLIWSDAGRIATLGVHDLVIVNTSDATLVAPRNRSEDLKAIVSQLKLHDLKLTELHTTVHRPWGLYTVLEESLYFKIKRIVVNPKQKLSLQSHQHRNEHWVVIEGTATVTDEDKEFNVNKDESTYILKGHKHRLENKTDAALVLIEVQTGSYVGEDDIKRFDDHYGR